MMLSTDFFDCFDIIQKTDILITIGNTSAETKDLSCKIAYNNIESRFPYFFLYQLCSYRYDRYVVLGDI